MATQEENAYNYMVEHGGITSLEMFNKFYICSPQSVIRNLRHKYNILDEWKKIERKYIDEKGKERKKITKFKRWYLA